MSKQPLVIYRGLPICLGWDFGVKPGEAPACMAFQITPEGGINWLREYVSDAGGIRQFCERQVIPGLLNTFPGMRRMSWGDPSGKSPAQADSDISCIQTLGVLGIPTVVAPTQDPRMRREVIRYHLTRNIGKDPAMQVDPSCKMFIAGLGGGFHYAPVKSVGEARFKDKPDKNEYSHIVEAGEYGALGVSALAGQAATGRPRKPQAPPIQTDGWAGSVT